AVLKTAPEALTNVPPWLKYHVRGLPGVLLFTSMLLPLELVCTSVRPTRKELEDGEVTSTVSTPSTWKLPVPVTVPLVQFMAFDTVTPPEPVMVALFARFRTGIVVAVLRLSVPAPLRLTVFADTVP